MSSGVISSYLWAVFKPSIQTCFLCRFLGSCGKGANFVVTLFIINLLVGFEAIMSRFSCWVFQVLFRYFDHYWFINIISGGDSLVVQNISWDKIRPKGH